MTDRKPGLDYVRSAAIGCVVAAHFADVFYLAGRRVYPLGTLGVEIFFVLSGFLIGGIFLRSVERAGNRLTLGMAGHFWVRRWFRTLPNYVVFLGLFAVIDHMSLGWDARRVVSSVGWEWSGLTCWP